jgi:hypothetical protein
VDIRRTVSALVLVTCAACTSTTSGSGHVDVRPSVRSASESVRPGPVELTPPGVCATPDCRLVHRAALGAGDTVALYGNTSADGGAGAAILEFAAHGTSTYWRVFAGQTPSQLECAAAATPRNCVVVDYVGAHGALAYPVVVLDGGPWVGEPVTTDTPDLRAADLDGDGRVDAFGVQNDYRPSYAEGAVQWQTWRRSRDGTAFASSGCGPLVRRTPRPPTTLLTGACPP